MTTRGLRVLSLALCCAALATEEHVMIPMRDGARISTFIYLPKGSGPWPVLYEQRYGSLESNASHKRAEALAVHGYVIVEQNFRGTQKSEGVFSGYRPLGWGEQQDGYDTVEWLAKQSWSNGKIATFGGSQAGYAQNYLAGAAPPHLVCQYIQDGGLSLFHLGYRMGGVTRPGRFMDTYSAVARVKEEVRRDLEIQFQHPDYDAYWQQQDSY